MNYRRRDFFKIAGIGTLASTFTINRPVVAKPAALPLKLGLASYSFRKFSLDQTIEMTKRCGLKHIALKSMHMPLNQPGGEIRKNAEKVRSNDLDLYGAGVIYMRKEEEVHQAFDYARAANLKVIIGVPNHEFLDLVDKKVKEYDIIVAIHNHGPGDDVYPSPQSVYEKVKNLDKRIGLCMDIGHTTRIGLDPSEEAKKYQDRLFDVHVKDVTANTSEGSTVEIGRGIIDIPKFLKTLIEIKYNGIVSLEYEKDADDPLVGAAESIGYLKGVMSVI